MNKNLIVAAVVLLAGISTFAIAQVTEMKTVPAPAATTSAPVAAPGPANEAPAGAVTAKAMIATRAMGASQKCRLVSNGTVNVNFNDLKVDISKTESILDDKVKAIEALGTEAGVKKLIMQSMNYNANSRGNGNSCGDAGEGTFQANGNINFKVEPASAAPAFAALLAKKGYNASFNVNKYRQCGNFAANAADEDDAVDESEE